MREQYILNEGTMKKILLLFLVLCSFTRTAFSDLTWSAPQQISTSGINVTIPQVPKVVIDSNGNATAVWLENAVLMSSTYSSSSSQWSSIYTLSNTANTASRHILGIDSSGNVTALWLETSSTESNNVIESAVYTASTQTWSTETSPISNPGASTPALAVDGSGNAVAVWALGGAIQASVRPGNTASWGSVATLSSVSSTSNSNPSVAISSSGIAMAAFQAVISGFDVIQTNAYDISSNSWGSTPTSVFTGTAYFLHNYPQIALDPNGNAALAWFRYNLIDSDAYGNVQVLASTLTNGASAWATESILSDSGSLNPANLVIKLKFDDSGNAVAVWINCYDGMTFYIEASKIIYGSESWLGYNLPQNPSLYSLGMDFTISSATGLLTTMSYDGDSSIIISSQETDTLNPFIVNWTSQNQFSTGDNNGFPSSAIYANTSNYYAAAVWMTDNGTNLIINASTGIETPLAPPTSLTVNQTSTSFGNVYTDYTNTISWTASTDPDVQQYLIFRNGVYFGEIYASTSPLQFEDHNQSNSPSVTTVYGVAAIDSNYRMSSIITISFTPS